MLTYHPLLKFEAFIVCCVRVKNVENECYGEKDEKTWQHVVNESFGKIERIRFGFWFWKFFQHKPITRELLQFKG